MTAAEMECSLLWNLETVASTPEELQVIQITQHLELLADFGSHILVFRVQAEQF